VESTQNGSNNSRGVSVSYWFRNDNRLPQARLAVVSYVIVGMIGVLLIGFWKLQVIDSDKYSQWAERNRVRSIPVIAPRGRMLDRDGRVLVDNYPSFSVLLLRDDPALVMKSLPAISEGLGVPVNDLMDQLDNARELPKFQPIVIKPQATPGDVAFIESHHEDIPLLEMLMVHRRRYLPNGFMAHASGYVGEVSEKQIEDSNGKLRPGDFAGKTGLERQYNELLQGTDGMRRVIVNSVGKEVDRLPTQEAIPGKQIQLTIDYDLQAMAEQSLGVRAIQAQLAPGSVFKIVTGTAMLEDKNPPESFQTYCPGYGTFYGRQFKCWVYFSKKGATSHGVMDLHQAILHSCDVFFYAAGQRLGIDRLFYYGDKLGIGHKTGIDLPSEEGGLMPSEAWVERVFHRKWYAGETISVSTGQGAVTTTPLQLARMIGGIASGGVFKQPHLLKDAQNVGVEKFAISEPTVEKITDAMYGVVNEPGGTGTSLKLTGVEFSGKSGTAQVIGYDTRARFGKQKKFEDNAWFVGYAPKRNPEIAVAVLVQESGQHGGEASGPVVRDIIKAYYDKKNKVLGGATITATDTKPLTKPPEPTKFEPGKALPHAAVQPVGKREPHEEIESVPVPTAARTDPNETQPQQQPQHQQ
jgi:penicillin-binding protein 2